MPPRRKTRLPKAVAVPSASSEPDLPVNAGQSSSSSSSDRPVPGYPWANMALNVEVPRLLGSSFVHSKIPRFMRRRSDQGEHLRVESSFLSTTHLYLFYSSTRRASGRRRVRLARLCLYSRAWERISSFTAAHPRIRLEREEEDFCALPLPWLCNAASQQVVLLFGDRASLLEISLPVKSPVGGPLWLADSEEEREKEAAASKTITCTIRLVSSFELPEGGTPREVRRPLVDVHYRNSVVDPARRAIYTLATFHNGSIFVGGGGGIDLPEVALYRLDCERWRWQRLLIPPPPPRQGGVVPVVPNNRHAADSLPLLLRRRLTMLMAVYGGRLYLAPLERSWLSHGIRRHGSRMPMVQLKEVLVVDPATKTVEQRPVERQLTGGSGSAAAAQLLIEESTYGVQFVQVGDTVYLMNALVRDPATVTAECPQGEPPTWDDERGRLRVMKNQLLALSLPDLQLRQINDGPSGDLFMNLPHGSSCPPSPPSPGPTPAKQRKSTSSLSKASTTTTTTTAPAVYLPKGNFMAIDSFHLVATPDRGELWAVSAEVTSVRPAFKMLQVTLPARGLASLSSLCLETIILRRPVVTLTSRGGASPLEGVSLAERRSFVRRCSLISFAERHLPEPEGVQEARQRKIEAFQRKIETRQRLIEARQRTIEAISEVTD